MENPGEAPARSGAADFQMNWLSRFLHIKPASRALCFDVRRGKVRQELVYLLRDWQRYGVRDVTCDRNTNVISARVDKNNRKFTRLLFTAWSLEEYTFTIELEEAFPFFARNVPLYTREQFQLTISCIGLNLKPVTFVIELFVVLEDSKRANLCLARFTQTRGAASSFRRAVEVIEDICREKRILIDDEQKKAAMCEILS